MTTDNVKCTLYKDIHFNDKIDYLWINEVETHVEGDLFYESNYNQIRHKIQFKSYRDNYGKVDLLIDIEPQVKIDENWYFTKSITKAEQFKDEFQKCYEFLDLAKAQNKKVLWEFG